jgi:hypothetical protein
MKPPQDGHFSRTPITRRLEQPTRKSIADRIGPPAGACAPSGCSLFGLAPGGVCLARPVARPAGELLPHRFTLAERVRGRTRRFAFCCTFPDLATGGRYPPPYPAEPGLSSRPRPIHRSRSTDGRRPSGPLRIQPSTVTAKRGENKRCRRRGRVLLRGTHAETRRSGKAKARCATLTRSVSEGGAPMAVRPR